MSAVVEIVSFSLVEGMTDVQVAETFEGVNNVLAAQPGFQYRSQSQDGKGQWFDVIYWENMEMAQAGSVAFMDSSAGQALCALIDENTCHVRHMEVSTSVMGCTPES
ncbi:hypothetical protein [Neptunomonas sp.]|uniref:antibiotic biosynthesis monooxygenase family protein n=1 Tax=Neptunomonas sp. TaxID=1971898 RepID=UPI0025D3D541|nr:hypothetical protein [Neptunomonas sp.]